MTVIDLRRPGRWTGGSLAPLPFESPESALWKFAWANEITLGQGYLLFDEVLTHGASEEFSISPRWARALDGWSDRTNGLSRPLICEWLWDDDDLLFETNWLRFCPICFGAGYHSWWHQSQLHDLCLLHDCRLVTGCRICGTPVAIDRCGRSSFRQPYICPQCSNPLAGVAPTWEAMIDLGALQKALVDRYGAWMYWLEKLGTLRRGWHRVFPIWYDVVPDEQLAQARMSRERAALLQMCPAPPPVCVRMTQPVVTTVIAPDDTMDYDPGQVIREFLASTMSTFDATDWEQYWQCQASVQDGQRVKRGRLRTAPLAAWVVRLYVDFCKRSTGRQRYWGQPARRRWVAGITGNVDVCASFDAGGLREVLMALYAETYAWLSLSSTRETFDLELSQFRVTPGISAYLITECAADAKACAPVLAVRQSRNSGKGRDLESVIVVRPKLPMENLPVFSLQQDRNRKPFPSNARRGECPVYCWKATVGCDRRIGIFGWVGLLPANRKAAQSRGPFPVKPVLLHRRGACRQGE